jgi:hypothetical protein
MRKFTMMVLAVLFVVATAAPVMATDARQQALAGVGYFIEDDYNIFNWPATLTSYSNMVWVGLGNYYEYYGDAVSQPASGYMTYLGASYGLGKENKYGTLAMFLYDYGPPLNPYSGGAWPGSGVFDMTLSNKWTLMWAYPMEKLSLGLYFNRADNGLKHDEAPTTTNSYEDHAAYTTFGASVRFDIGDKSYTDLAFNLSMASYKEENTSYGDIKDNAHTKMGFMGRMFYQWNETITWVPFVSFMNYDFSLKADSTDYVDNYWGDKGTAVTIGLGANIKVNEDNMLIFAVEPFDYLKRQPSDPPSGVTVENKFTNMPVFFLALESDVRDWMTVRAGAYKGFYKDEYNTEASGGVKSDYTYTGAYYDFFLGLGFHVGDFDIDAVLNNDLPFRLGYWLTGFQPYSDWSDAPVYMITTTYHF